MTAPKQEDNVIDLQTRLYKKGLWRTKEIARVKLREPKVKDLLGLDFTGEKTAESLKILISRLSGLSLEIIDEMHVIDYLEVCDRVNLMVVRAAK